MPALPNAANILKAGYKMGLGTDTNALVRLFIAFSGTSDVAKLNAVAGVLSSAWDTWLQSVHPNQVTLEEVEVTDLTSDTSPSGGVIDGTAGTLTGGLAAGTAMVISSEIARRYRGGHPRAYWPMGSEAKLGSAQTWDPTFVADVVTAYTGFVGACLTGWPSGITPVDFVNVSYFHGFTNHTYPSGRTRSIPTVRGAVVIDPVTSWFVRQSVGSQRRRNQFVG